eukprot:933545-Amorphochlora_amoeboformis.AAC.1
MPSAMRSPRPNAGVEKHVPRRGAGGITTSRNAEPSQFGGWGCPGLQGNSDLARMGTESSRPLKNTSTGTWQQSWGYQHRRHRLVLCAPTGLGSRR